jgi:molybdate/tungstate transport system substrate-binding protein
MRSAQPTGRSLPFFLIASVLLAAALAAAGCGSSPSAGDGSRPHKQSTGTANLGAAGSLESVVQSSVGPAFVRATGYHLSDRFAGSSDIANSIMNGELSPGVFMSIGAAPIRLLWPSRSRFAVSLATDPLVVAYSKKSRYAAQLDQIRTGKKPLSDLFSLMEKPGFRLGRTDPNADPQGGFFILMVELATKELHLPASTPARVLGTSASNDVGSSSQILDETALPTDIETASVDAGSEYLTEARQYKLEYITLPNTIDFADPAEVSLYSTLSLKLTGGVVFTGGLITLDATLVLPPKGEPRPSADEAADKAFFDFIFSRKGRTLLRQAGYVLEPPQLELASSSSSASSVLPRPALATFHRLGGTISASS